MAHYLKERLINCAKVVWVEIDEVSKAFGKYEGYGRKKERR